MILGRKEQAEIIKHPEDIIIEPCQSLEDIFFEVGPLEMHSHTNGG